MTQDELQKLFEQEQCRELAWAGHCHDCHTKTTVVAHVKDDGELQITGGAVYQPEIDYSGTTQFFIKCNKCLKQDPVLQNYKPTETYSRIVGYLRPVQQWNPGKRAEFDKRLSFIKGKEENIDNSPLPDSV